MYNISIDINKYASENFTDGLIIANNLGINNVEICDFEGKHLWQLSGIETENFRNALIDYNKKIVLATVDHSTDDLEGFKKLFRTAHLLNVENIKIDLNSENAPDLVCNLIEIAKMGYSYGIRILFENSHNTFLYDDEGMTSFYNKFEGVDIGFIYNPIEFVACQKHPFFHMFYTSKLKNDIVFLRLNDGLYSSLEAKPLCQGNGEVKELVSILLSRSFKGYFSITPYMKDQTLEDFKNIHEDFKKMVKNL